MDVFFFEAFDEEQVALKRYNRQRFEVGYSWKTIQEYGATMPPAPVVSVRTQSLIPPEWSGHIRAVLSRSTGYDHLAEYRSRAALPVRYGYLPLYCNRAVAEQAMLLWLALLRKLPRQMVQLSCFDRHGITGRETAGKRLLVVGVGNIGSEVVKLGQALNMSVKGVDPVKKHDYVDYAAYEAAAPDADIIVCAMNLTPENNRYFDYERLRRAKPGALFVNIARGEFAPLRDLSRLLDEQHLGGVGLDVYENESRLGPALRGGAADKETEELAAVRDLMRRDNVIMTPHNAFNTAEAVDRKAEQSFIQLSALRDNGDFLWPVP